MKVQIRQGVFETNSSSTHSLAIYNKKEWEEFQKGNYLMGDGYLGQLKKKEDFYENYEREENGPWGDKNPTPEGFEDWIHDNTYDSDTFDERYEVLTEEIPDSDYVAVSIFSYEG